MNQLLRSIAPGLLILALASLACTLPGQVQPTPDPAGIAEKAQQTLENKPVSTGEVTAAVQPTATLAPTLTPTPTPTSAPSLPVGLRKGLASLDSYHIKIQFIVDGPTSLDRNHEASDIFYNADGDRMHTHVETLNSTSDDVDFETTTIDHYKIGPVECSLPADEDEGSPLAPVDLIAQEMNDVIAGLSDFMIYVDDPAFIGEESINGVAARHYRFEVSGLGKQSGAEVTQSAGEYWTAVDGNYLVKYTLLLETRSAPEGSPDAKVMHAEIHMDLSEINQPITIEMPPECQ